MKLQVLLDLHLEFDPLEKTAVELDGVALAGNAHAPVQGAARWNISTRGR